MHSMKIYCKTIGCECRTWPGDDYCLFCQNKQAQQLDHLSLVPIPEDDVTPHSMAGVVTVRDEAEYTGGSVSYYSVGVQDPASGAVPYIAECSDIIEALGMDFNEGNAFKAIWRKCAARTLGKAKLGYKDGLYDAEKVVYFGERMVTVEQRKQR